MLVRARPRRTSGRNGQRGRQPPAPHPRLCRRRPGSTSSPTPRFGFLVSEAGAGFTWAGNSQANRLTPWSNDPVSDPPGEVVYLRDEETGEVWSPTPLPVPAAAADARPPRPGLHRLRAEHATGSAHELTAVRPARRPGQAHPPAGRATRATGRGGSRRRSTPSGCSGTTARRRGHARRHRGRPRDRRPAGAERLPRRLRRAGRLRRRRPAAADAHRRPRRVPRPERLASPRPAALGRVELSGRVGAGARPLRRAPGRRSTLAPGETSRGRLPARRGRRRRRRPATWSAATASPAAAAGGARRGPGRAGTRSSAPSRSTTPDPALDLLLNRWLLYQVLSLPRLGRGRRSTSRAAPTASAISSRTCMALVHAAPEVARAQHPARRGAPVPRGRRAALVAPAGGPRRPHALLRRPPLAAATSPATTSTSTGDAGVLDEIGPVPRRPPLLRARPGGRLRPAGASPSETATLYEHCAARPRPRPASSARTACR